MHLMKETGSGVPLFSPFLERGRVTTTTTEYEMINVNVTLFFDEALPLLCFFINYTIVPVTI